MDLLERDSQLAVLNAALAEVKAGKGRIALVSGEAGIGKTSLVDEFTRRHRNHVRVLWGICDALFTPRPLGPMHDIATQMGGKMPELLVSSAERTSIFPAVLSDLQSRTTIIVFEDIHWADESTLDLLRFIGRRITQTQALVVMTYRDDELSLEHPLRIALGDLLTSPGTRRILLPPFSERAVRKLIGEREFDAVDLHQRTGGNPFFVNEVLDSPVHGIPATVRDAVLARAARLSADAHPVLDAAAVIGLRINLRLLEKVAEAEIEAVDECIATGLLLPKDNGLSFRHELTRQTILDTMSPQRKLLLHRAVLEALTSSPGVNQDVTQIAHHAEAIGDREAVLKYAPQAARQASAKWAHREAATLYASALRFADQLPAAAQAEMLEQYARACNLTEQQAKGVAALRRALDLWKEHGNPLKQGETLAFLSIILRNHGNNLEAEERSRAAIELLETLPPSRELALAYRVQATLLLANRDIHEALSWGRRAVELAERFEAENILATAHVAAGSALLFLDYEQGCAYLEEQLELGRRKWHERYIANLLAYLGSCSVELHHLRRAENYLAEGIAFTFERGMDIFHRYMVAWMALAYLHQGRWEEASEILNQTSLMPTGSVFSRIPTLIAVGILRARRGDPGAHSALDEALALAEPTGSLSQLGIVRAARAEAAWLEGNPRRAVEEAQAGYDLAVSRRHPWYGGEMAFWLWRAGEAVETFGWMAQPYKRHIAGEWQAAADEWQRLDCTYKRAQALADGDIQAQLAALEIFDLLEARPDADILRSKLQAAGISSIPRRPHSSTRENPFGLTNRQVDVLTLLVENLSNVEISARLHISPKTVDHHVSAVLNKLEVNSRAQAAALAQKHPDFQKK